MDHVIILHFTKSSYHHHSTGKKKKYSASAIKYTYEDRYCIIRHDSEWHLTHSTGCRYRLFRDHKSDPIDLVVEVLSWIIVTLRIFFGCPFVSNRISKNIHKIVPLLRFFPPIGTWSYQLRWVSWRSMIAEYRLFIIVQIPSSHT